MLILIFLNISTQRWNFLLKLYLLNYLSQQFAVSHGLCWRYYYFLKILSQPIIKGFSFQSCCACSIAQSCPTLCNPMDYSLPRFSVHGTFQAMTPEWGAISSSREFSWPRDRSPIPCISALADRFFTTVPLGKSNYFTVLNKIHNSFITIITYLFNMVSMFTGLSDCILWYNYSIDKCLLRSCHMVSCMLSSGDM